LKAYKEPAITAGFFIHLFTIWDDNLYIEMFWFLGL
jgi:hypothetical protein